MSPDAIAALLAPFLGGASISELQLNQLQQYLDLLQRWNARINLTAVRQPEQIVTRHFGESFFTARHLYPPGWKPETGNWKLFDLGSGAGFPGLPIKIWAPALSVTLLESIHRKAIFLREGIRALGLHHIEVFAGRAEAYATAAVNRESEIVNLKSLTLTLRAVERFDRILPVAVRLLHGFPAQDRRLALLIGASQITIARDLAPSLRFDHPLPLPQSAQRVLLLGKFPAPDS